MRLHRSSLRPALILLITSLALAAACGDDAPADDCPAGTVAQGGDCVSPDAGDPGGADAAADPGPGDEGLADPGPGDAAAPDEGLADPGPGDAAADPGQTDQGPGDVPPPKPCNVYCDSLAALASCGGTPAPACQVDCQASLAGSCGDAWSDYLTCVGPDGWQCTVDQLGVETVNDCSAALAHFDFCTDPPADTALPFWLDDHFTMSGQMGGGTVDVTPCDTDPGDPAAPCRKITWTPGGADWVGFYWLHPDGNWGILPGLPVAAGANRATFRAWGESGGESVNFTLGLHSADGFEVSTGYRPLSDTPTQYSVDLTGVEYGAVVGPLSWFIDNPSGAASVTIYLDDVQWTDEPPPTNEGCTDPTAANYDADASEDDGSCAYDVTFQVDMTGVALEVDELVYLQGSFNDWCGLCDPLSDDDADGLWTITTALTPGEHQYVYTTLGWEGLEEAVPVACDVTGGVSGVRGVTVPAAALVLDPHPWSACEYPPVPGCTDADAANYDVEATEDDGSCVYQVTFQVDLAGLSLEAGEAAHLLYDGNTFCADCDAMDDSDADGLWTLTVTLAPGAHEFLYGLAGGTAPQSETVPAACDVTGDASGRRGVTVVDAPLVLAAVPWGACAYPVPGCTDVGAANYDAAATEDDGSCTYAVTFAVDMSAQTLDPADVVHLNGTFNTWCGDCEPLTDADADGVWEVTIALPPGDIEYQFTVNGLTVMETVPGPCDVTGGSSGNRGATVAATGPQTLGPFVWGECYTPDDVLGCTDAAAQNHDSAATWDDGSCTYAVTFQVDASAEGLTAGDVVYLDASFDGWCGSCAPMDDTDGDGIWTLTAAVPLGEHEYRFTVGGATPGETLPAFCDVSTGADARRALTVTGDAVLPVVVYGSCWAPGEVAGCMDANASNYDASATVDDATCTYDVTFQVDMTAETLAVGDVVYLTGDFNAWCLDCAAMDDTDADGIWTLVVALPPGDVAYKLTLNGTVEVVPVACNATGVADGNRMVTVGAAAMTVPLHAWEGCAP